MLKIGDFSKLAQVSVRTLRYYDEIGLLKPHRIEKSSGYRLYSVEQLSRLNRILALRELGIDLEQVKELINTECSKEALRQMLLEQEKLLIEQNETDLERLQRVRARLVQVDDEHESDIIDVILKSAEAQPIVGNRSLVPTITDIPFFSRNMFAEIYRWLRRHHIPHSSTQAIL